MNTQEQPEKITEVTRKTLATLMLIPDDVVLDIAGREFDMGDANMCLCGWTLRDIMAKASGRHPETTNVYGWHDVPEALSRKLGGTDAEWREIFIGVTDHYQLKQIELAFMLRVELAAGGYAYA